MLRVAAYAWTSPNTLIGLVAGTASLCLGARVTVVRGVIEFSGGRAGRLAATLPPSVRFCAMTLGHAIIGVDDAALAAARDHEHVHVRQYERWGLLFLPAYFASSAWQLVRGRQPYFDNYFERQARAAGSNPSMSSSI